MVDSHAPDAEVPVEEMEAANTTTKDAPEMSETESGEEEKRELPEDLAHVVDETRLIMKVSKFAAARPTQLYAATCGSYCFIFIMLIVLALSVPSFFPFESGVPLYVRDHVARERLDAVITAEDDSNFILDQPELQLRGSVSSLGGARDDTTLEIIYLAEAGNVFELKNIQAIVAFEKKIRARAGYKDFCYVDYSPEARAVQESRNWTAVAEINAQEQDCAPPSTVFYACDPTAGASCDSALSTPIGILDCPKATACTEDEFVVSESFKDDKLRTYSQTAIDLTTPAGNNAYSFLKLVDSGFSDGNLVAQAVRTEFFFGAPLAGYKTVIDDADGQSDDLADFLYEEFYNFLMDTEVNGEIEILFNGHGMLPLYIADVLIKDAMFLLAAMVFSWFYMTFMVSSVFLATMGIGQVVLSFGPAYFLYFGVFQQRYFGVFNILSIFIILGIGADDIFVYLDTWERAKLTLGTTDKAKMLAFSWAHAGKAMLITSTTTIFSFVSNANSSFPAIQTFGIFAALLVLVNYCAVMIHFPMCVMVHEVHFSKSQFLCGLPEKLKNFCRGGFKGIESRVATIEPDAKAAPAKSEPAANRWFRESFGTFVINANIGILIAFVLLTVFLTVAVSKLEVDKGAMQFFPSGDNFQDFIDTKPDYFARGGSVDAATVELVWGINPDEPIDRAGTRATDMDNLGEVNWDKDFSISVAAECMVSICLAAEAKSDSRKTSGPSSIPIDCMMMRFKTHVLSAYNQTTWDAITGPNADAERFEQILMLWVSDPSVLSYVSEYTFPLSDGNGNILYVMALAELKLTVRTSNLEPTTGIEIWEVWEAWVAEQYTKSPCLEVKDQARMFQSSLENSFVKDTLQSEAFNGIYLSVGLSGVVLMFATQNVLLAIYATGIISMIVISTMGTTVLMGWKLGVLESIGFVMVPGLSVDFIAHFADSYIESTEIGRHGRLQDMLATSGVAIASGAFSTLGATMFLFFPQIIFFVKFGTMIFVTIGFSLLWSMLCFPAILSTPLGPEGNTGNWLVLVRKLIAKCKGEKASPEKSSPAIYPTHDVSPA
ncbi:Protein dispatched [Diplonema papillatum]|nr:Protein dispatched [Diplonema papillatum]